MLKNTTVNTYLYPKCPFTNPFAAVRLLDLHIAYTHKIAGSGDEGNIEHDITLERGLYKYVWQRGRV